jgi:hypothetical protein
MYILEVSDPLENHLTFILGVDAKKSNEPRCFLIFL